MKRVLLLALVVILGVAPVCGSEKTNEPGGGGSTPERYLGTWELTSGTGPEGDVPVNEEWPITLEIKKGGVSGTAACNSYSGRATITETSFSSPGFALTEMGCATKVMEAETAYIAALGAINSISGEEDSLTLSGENAELEFALLPPVPTASLTDTFWKLESLVEGEGPDGIAIAAEKGELELSKGGTLIGSSGCRHLIGKWIENGNEIQVTEFAAHGKRTQDLKDQDDHVVGVLGDGFSASIEGQTLTLTATGGQGLIYRAK